MLSALLQVEHERPIQYWNIGLGNYIFQLGKILHGREHIIYSENYESLSFIKIESTFTKPRWEKSRVDGMDLWMGMVELELLRRSPLHTMEKRMALMASEDTHCIQQRTCHWRYLTIPTAHKREEDANEGIWRYPLYTTEKMPLMVSDDTHCI